MRTLAALVVRVVENERGGVIVCANGVADELVNIGDATYAMPGFGASRGSGFAGAGRVHTSCLASARPAGVVSRARGGCIPRGRSFFLQFYHGGSRRATKGHGALPCYTIGN
jgi:hypothetical protein